MANHNHSQVKVGTLTADEEEVKQVGWAIKNLQLDMIENTPTITLRNEFDGDVVTIRPDEIAAFEVDQKTVFAAAYLKGYSDRHHDDILGKGISQLIEQLRL